MGKSSINGPFPMAMLNNQRVHDDALVHPPNLHRPELWTSEGPSYTSQTTGDFPGKAIYSPCSSMIYRFQKCWLSRRFNYQRLDPTKSYIPYHSFIPLHPYCYILPYEHPLKKTPIHTDPHPHWNHLNSSIAPSGALIVLKGVLGLVVIPSADVQTAAGTLGHFLDKKREENDETGGDRPAEWGQMWRWLTKWLKVFKSKLKHKKQIEK